MSRRIFIEQFRRLLNESREKNEFEFVNVLLGYKGMGGMMSLTHFYESQSLFEDMSTLITKDHENKNNVRIGLFLYSHFFEMDELYRVIGNLLNIINGGHFKPFLFEDLEADELTPSEKISDLKELSAGCGFSDLTECIDELYSNKLRNSFFHSNYSIDKGEYLNTSRRHTIKIRGKERHSLNIETELYPLIMETIQAAKFFFSEIEENKKSYTSNRIINGNLSLPEPVMILGDEENGLIGWQSSSGSAIKITYQYGSPFLAAYNIRITPKMNGTELKLSEIIDRNKYAKNDPDLIKLEAEIVAENNPERLKQLAVPYYNAGNNTKERAEKSENIYEKKALIKTAIEKYKKSLEFDPGFVRAMHNLAISEKELRDLDGQKTSYGDLAEKIAGLSNLADDFPEALFNAGHFSQIEAQETKDGADRKAWYLKAIGFYERFLKEAVEKDDVIERLGRCYWGASLVDNNTALAHKALGYFEELLEIAPEKVQYLLSFAAFLSAYAIIEKDEYNEKDKRALCILEKADKLSPENGTILYRTGTTKSTAAEKEIDREAKELYLIGALDSFEKALSVDPGNTDILNNIGFAHIKLGWFYGDEKSENHFYIGIAYMNDLIKNHPELSNSYYNKASALVGLFEITEFPDFLREAKQVTDYAQKEHPGSVDDIIKAIEDLWKEN
ncbi:hypothetical protein [Chryseobacterium sp.]|uniref:hypothetical protein n=1 Tax=Chryseobacterium sp. TaxID=1871047 RepID=UPI0031CFFC69